MRRFLFWLPAIVVFLGFGYAFAQSGRGLHEHRRIDINGSRITAVCDEANGVMLYLFGDGFTSRTAIAAVPNACQGPAPH